MKVGIVIPPRQKGARLPLSALYIVSVLTASHNEVQVIDLTHCQGVIPRDKFKSDMGIYWIVSNSNYNRAMQVKGFMPSLCTTIISGSDPTLMPEILVKSGWDYVLTGDPELAANGVISNIFRRGIIHCQTPTELDELPFPARSTVRLTDYYGQIGPDSVADVIASRSYGKKPRTRSIGNVIAELKHLNRNHRFTNFKISDHGFISRHEDLVNFCTEIIPMKFTIELEVTVDKLNSETLPSLLKMAGVKRLKLLKATDDRNYSKLIKKLREEGTELYGPATDTSTQT